MKPTVLLLLSFGILSAVVESQQRARDPARTDAQLLQDFQTRIDNYMALHNRLEKQSPPLGDAAEPAQIRASQDALAAKIRAARKDASGQIFTPEICTFFRRLISLEVRGPHAAQTKEVLQDEAPSQVMLRVNGPYPEGLPLPSVPPNLLAALPKLPDDLEYRFVINVMILRDVHANLIIDFFPNAIQQ